MGKMRKYKLKNKKIWIGIILLILISGGFIVTYKLYNDRIKENIKKHYSTFIITNKKTSLYDKNKKEIGTISKDFPLELKKIKITNKKTEYFQIKDTNYYIYYEDTKVSKEIEKDKINENYIEFNKNIETTKKINLYENDKKVITLKKGINLPIEYEDENNYYVYFQKKLLKVEKGKDIKEEEAQNTEEKEATHISNLYYESIEDSCKNYNCTTIENLKEQLNKLKENGYYTISLEDYKNYVKGYIHLKENAILLTTSSTNEKIDSIQEELKVRIERIDDSIELKFTSTNKTMTTENSTEEWNRYQIKTYTPIENLLKMAAGEEVKETDPTPVSNSTSGQGIAVLNYHFFYDSSLGESCNEGICLEVSKFREQLQYLKDNGFKTLTMGEFKKWMYGEIELPTKSVLITIDDGAMGTGAHNGNKLIPLLEEFKMNATLFLIAGWWDIGNYQSPYLTIQSHTYDMHQYGPCGRGQLNCATYEEAKADLQKSLDIIGNNDSFCFPFYYYSDTSIQAVKDSGFKLAFVGGMRKATRSSNKYLVPRYPIHSDITLERFINMVN